jgi:HAE1 family hydrophobic/amphiphilic exporter-1
MVIQFERFMQPLIIMAAIPFCLIGVVLGLYLFGSGLSIIAMLAIIALGGTVVNNAIVLVDYTNLLRKNTGMDCRDAVLEGAGNRLRPILMTAMTTIFGVLPMALAAGNGSEVYAPLGQAIFGGLISSTVITLIIVPILYETLERRTLAFRAAFNAPATEIPE